MFRYTVDFPLNKKTSTYIIKKLGNLQYNYKLTFDHDIGFLKFNIELKNKIGAIMDQITDIVGAQRGEYTIIDNATGDEVCLDALNDEYPASEYKQYRYRLYHTLLNVDSSLSNIFRPSSTIPSIVTPSPIASTSCKSIIIGFTDHGPSLIR